MNTVDFIQRVRAHDWSRYREAAHGFSISETLAAVASSDPSEASSALSGLELFVLPRGILGAPAYDCIPFLLELIEARYHRELIYELLVPIAICSMPDAVDRDFVQDGVVYSLASMCRERLSAGSSVYIRDVLDTSMDDHTRGNALSMIEYLPACWDEARAALAPYGRSDSTGNTASEVRDWLARQRS